MMRLNNFFIGDPDKYERLISALQFCAEYNPEKLNLKHMSSCLEKGMFYRGMLNFPSTSLNLELQSLLEKFTEFDQRIMLTESMIYIKQSGPYQLRQRLEYFVHEMQSNIQVLSRNDIYFIIRIHEELIILIPDDMNQIALLHISNDIEYYDKEGDKQFLHIFNKTMETIMVQYRYTQSSTTTATTNNSISGNDPRSSINNTSTSTSIKDNPYSIEIACILNICRDVDNDTNIDQDDSYIQAKYEQLSTWMYNHAKQEKVATIQSLRKQLDFLHIQKYEINMSLNDTIFTKLFQPTSRTTTTQNTLTNTLINVPSSSSNTNRNSNILDSTETNVPAISEDIALNRDTGQSNVHISDVNKSTSRLDELLALTIQQGDTNETMKVKIRPQLWIHTDDDNINNIEMHPNSANSGTSHPISSTTPSIRPSTASRPPTAPSSSSSNNQNRSAMNTTTNNSNSHDYDINNHSLQNRQLSTSPLLDTSSSSTKSQHLLTLVKNKSPKLRGSHNSSSTSALLTPSSPSSSGLFTYSSSSSNLCTSRSIPSYPNNNNNDKNINDNITKEIIEHHTHDVSDKHDDYIHENTDNPLDPLQSTSEFIMNPDSDNTTNHQDPFAYQNTHLDINTTTNNNHHHHETEDSTLISITSSCHSPTVMSPRTPMTPTTPSMKHKSYTNLFDQITSSPSLLTTLSMPLISPSMKNKSLILDKSFSNKESFNIYTNNPTTYETNTSEDNVNLVDVDTMTSYTTNDDNHITSNDKKDDHIQRLVGDTKEEKSSTKEESNSYIYISDASITNHENASNIDIDIDIDTYIDDALIYKHDKESIDSSNVKMNSSTTVLKPDTIISNYTETKPDEVSSYIQLAYQAIKDMVFSETIFTPSSTLNSTFDPSQLQLTATLSPLQDDEQEVEKDENNDKDININEKEYNSNIIDDPNLRSIHVDDKSYVIKSQEVNSSNTTLKEEKDKSSNADDVDKLQLSTNTTTTTVSHSNHNNRDNTDNISKEFFTNMNEPHDQIDDKSKETDISINSLTIQSNIIPTQLNISASHSHIHTKNLISSDPSTTGTQSGVRPSTAGGITKYLYPMNQYIIPSLDRGTLEDTAATTTTTTTNTDYDDNDNNVNNTNIDLIKTCDPDKDADVDVSLFHLEKITPLLKEVLDQDTSMFEFHNLLTADILSDKSSGYVEDNGNMNIPILVNDITSSHVNINTLENDKIVDIADVSFPMNSVQESILVPPSQLEYTNNEDVIPTNVVHDNQRSIRINDEVLVRPMTAQQYTSTPIVTTTSTIPLYRKSMSSFDHHATYDDVQQTPLPLDEEIINSSYFRSSIGSYKLSKLSKDKVDYGVHVYENMNHINSSSSASPSLILNDTQDKATHDMDDHMSEDDEMTGPMHGEKDDIWSHKHTPSLSLSVSSPKLSQVSSRNTDTSPLNTSTLAALASGQRASTIKLPITPTRSSTSKSDDINADQLSTSTSLFADHMKTPIPLSARDRSFSTPILPHSASAKFLLPSPRTIVNDKEERVKDIRSSLSHQDIESLLNEVFPIESTSQQQPLVNYTSNDNDDVSVRSSDKSNENVSNSSVEDEVNDLYHNHDDNSSIDGPYDELGRIQSNISDNDIYAHQTVRDDEEKHLDHSLSLNDVKGEKGLSMISSTNKLNDFYQREIYLNPAKSMTSSTHNNIQTTSYESNMLSALDTYKQMRASMKKSYDTLNISDSSLQTSSSTSSPKMVQPPLISSSEKKEVILPTYNKEEGYKSRPNSARRLSQQNILPVVRDSMNDRLISSRLDVKADNNTSPRSALSHSGRPPTATTFIDHDNLYNPEIRSISPKYIPSPRMSMRNSMEMKRTENEDTVSEHESYMRASSKPFIRDSVKSLHSIDSTPSISYGDIIPDNDLLHRTTASDINTTYPSHSDKNNQVSYNSEYYATGDDDDDSKDFEISTSINDSITQQQTPIINSFHNQMNTQQLFTHQNDSHYPIRNSFCIIDNTEKTLPLFPPTISTTTNYKETNKVSNDHSRVSSTHESKTHISPRFERKSMKDNTILNNSEMISHITPIASSTTTTNTTISAADSQDKRTSISSFISQVKVLDNVIDKNDLLKVKSVLENKQKNELSIKNRHRLKVGHEAYQLLLQEGLLDTTPAAILTATPIPIANSNDEHLRHNVVTTPLSDNNISIFSSRTNNITSLEPSRMMPIPKNTTTTTTTTTNILSHENPSNSQQSIQQLQSKVLEDYSPRIQRLPSRERKIIQDREIVTIQSKSNEHSHTQISQISGELYTNRNDYVVKAIDTPTNTITNNSISDPHNQIRAAHGNRNNYNNNNNYNDNNNFNNDNSIMENDDDLVSVTSKSTYRRKAEKFDIILSSDQHSTRPTSSRNSSRNHSNYTMKNTNQNQRLPDTMNEENNSSVYDNTVSDNDMKHMEELRQRKIRELERKALERQKNRRDQSINDYNNSVSSPSQVLSPKSNHNRNNSSISGSGSGSSGKNRENPQVPNRSNGGNTTTTHIHSPPPLLPGNNSTTYSNNNTAYTSHDVRPDSRSSRNNNNSSSSSSRNNRRPDNASPTNNNSYDSKIDYHSYYEDNGLRDTYHQLPQPPQQRALNNNRQSTDRNVHVYESDRPRTSSDAVVIGNKEAISIQKNSNTNNDNNNGSYGQNRQYYESKHNDEYENDSSSDKRTSSKSSRSRSHTPSQRGLMNTNSNLNTGINLSPRQQDDDRSVTTSERRRPGSTNRTRTPPSTAVISTPSKLSNVQQIKNALTFVCLAGFHYENDRTQALQILDKIYALSQDPDILDKGGVIITQFIILFYRSKSLSFRGVYGIDYRTQDMLKLFGRGPRILDSNTYNILEYLKYESSTKSFKPLPSKSLTSTTDAISIDPSQIKSKS